MKIGKTIFWAIMAAIFFTILICGITGKKMFKNSYSYNWNYDGYDSSENGIHLSDEEIHYEFDSYADISDIKIELVSERLNIMPAAEDKLTVDILYEGPQKGYITVYQSGRTLKIFREKQKVKLNLNKGATVTIKIPQNLTTNKIDYRIENVSGRISVQDINGKSFTLENVSGRTELENCTADDEIKAESVSGRIEISLKQLNDSVRIENVSGGIELLLPADADFYADYESVSGSIDTNFRIKGSHHEGTFSNGTGKHNINLETVSGSIKVNRN